MGLKANSDDVRFPVCGSRTQKTANTTKPLAFRLAPDKGEKGISSMFTGQY